MKKSLVILFCVLSGIASSIYYKEELIDLLIPVLTYFTSISYNTKNNNNEYHELIKTPSKNIYELHYKYNNKLYKICIPIKKGPTNISDILDENGNDISEKISPYLGPNEDLHFCNISPKYLGYSKIYIHTIFDKIYVFENNDKIEFNDKYLKQDEIQNSSSSSSSSSISPSNDNDNKLDNIDFT